MEVSGFVLALAGILMMVQSVRQYMNRGDEDDEEDEDEEDLTRGLKRSGSRQRARKKPARQKGGRELLPTDDPDEPDLGHDLGGRVQSGKNKSGRSKDARSGSATIMKANDQEWDD